MKALVVYEMVPDETRVYSLEVDENDLDTLKACHGAYINLDGWEEFEEQLMWLDRVLPDAELLTLDQGQPLDIAGHDILVHTGFIC